MVKATKPTFYLKCPLQNYRKKRKICLFTTDIDQESQAKMIPFPGNFWGQKHEIQRIFRAKIAVLSFPQKMALQ